MLDLIYDIQQGFGLEFDAEQMAGVRTVGDLVRFLASKQST
jgi:acyl carrier protein